MTSTRLNDDTLATVLLCGGLGAQSNTATPLTIKEWNGLVRSLIHASWRPGDLLRWGAAAARDALALDGELAARLDELLAGAVVVAVELERLTGAGIRVLARADEEYPSRWRARLREQSPPLLFVAGPVSLLERGGVAAVGSRDVDAAGAEFARAVGRAAAQARTPMISGGARGVDREAMFGALESGGDAIGIVPDGLARTLRSPDVRASIAEGQLVLASPHRPDAGFKVWRAMDRNKLIYALAEVSIVISSDDGRGGTWAGAVENLRNDWSPLFVRAGDDIPDGNRRLIELGAMPMGVVDLETTTMGGLLAHLRQRAERESAQTLRRPAQQSFLYAEDGGLDAPASPVQNGRFAVQEELSPAASNPRQIEFPEDC